MGAFEKGLKKLYKQTAVYWGNPDPDGFGGCTFDDPVEIICRWDDVTKVISDGKGNVIISRAVVMVAQDVDEEGMLFLGTLDDLDSGQEDNPKSVSGAFTIKQVNKIPAPASATEFFRKAYL